MHRRAQLILLCVSIIFATSVALAQKIVTAAQVNGTWQLTNGSRENEFRIRALGNNKLKIEFDGAYFYRVNKERTANTGTGAGIARIEGIEAHFRPEGAEEECDITLRFVGGKLIVKQEGICGFGHNVSAEGTYRKVNSTPKFDQ